MSELHLRKSFVVLIVFAILALIFLASFVIPPAIEKIQCEKKGGKWADMIGGGCGMSPDACKDAGGIPVGYLQCRGSMFAGCLDIGIDGCEFR